MLCERRVALVTGSTSGIGLAIARRLHVEGWTVILNGFDDAVAGERVAAELQGSRYVDADVGSSADARRLIEAALEHAGQLDLVVNNAGIARRIPHPDLEAVSDEFWDRVMRVNLAGPWNVTKAAAESLRASSGQVVNVASIAGLTAAGSSIPYAVSKAGVVHLTKLLAAALGPLVRVNALAPGYIDTPLTHDWSDLRAVIERDAPAQRLGSTDDVVQALMGVLTMEYVTGVTIPIDGGVHLL